MGRAIHSDQSPSIGGVHVIHAFSHADETARLAEPVVALDIGKVSKQADNDTFYLLTSVTPATWVPIGSGGAAHDGLRSLIHFIDSGPADGFASGAFHEILPFGNPFPTSYIWWESISQIDKIVELTVTRGAGQNPITEVWEMYDTDGSTVLTTVTDTISYSGPFETSRTRVIA